jgi:DNA-binding PadR family transcriptional regulator
MSVVRLLVLGSILRKGICHGYGVYNDIISWRADTWTNVKPGSIYHALDKLEKQEMIEPTDLGDQVKRGPSRTEYTVTSKGKAEFEGLLETSLQSPDIQKFAVGIAFMDMLSRPKVISLLKERCASLKEMESFLKSLPTEEVPSEPSKHPELVGVWIRYVENQRLYTQNMLEAIQSGKYVFQFDKSRGVSK